MPSYALAVNDIVESRWNATLAGQHVMFVLHHLIGAGTPASTDLLHLQQALDSQVWEDYLSNQLSTDVTGCYWQSQVVSPTRKITNEIDCTPDGGVLDDPACPPTTAVVIRKRTATAGRKYRGRIFVPGIPFANITNGKVAAGSITAWDAVADQFQVQFGFDSRTATPIVYSTKDNTNRGTILDCNFDDVLRVQRRREVGRGI